MVSPISSLVRLGTFLILTGTGIHFLSAQVLEAPPITNQTETLFQQAEPPPVTPADLGDRVLTQQALRAYLQLQEQMHTALLAIQKGREDAQTAAEQNKEAVSERLKTIEATLVAQRAQESATTENSNRLVLIMAGALAGLGFLSVIIASSLQLRAMSRLAQVARSLSPVPHASATLPAMFGHEDRLLPANEAEQSTARLRSTVQTLQDRIHELEQMTQGNTSKLVPPAKSARPLPEPTLTTLDSEQAGRISLLLGKGQSLLHLNEAADALKCFDQVLVLDPRNTEALIKKGTSLERLKRLEAAIECYDQAIAINDNMTLAYLYKGGVYNQLERFNEALQCYEHALRTQQKDQLSAAG